MAETPVPPVDYLSRDYVALRSDLLAGIPSRVPEWTNRSSNDFGIALLELFAYVGDGLHYYIDRVANESFLATATQRQSVLAFARLLDYRPSGALAAQVSLTFGNSTSSGVVVPAGTRVATSTANVEDAVYFETQAAVTVPANSSASTLALEGTTVALEEVGVSSGFADQDFTLAQTSIIDGSVQISVTEASGALWTYTEHLLDAAPNDPAFALYTDERDVTHVVFGDGVNGNIPAPAAAIRARYRVGGGRVGNIGENQITRFVTTVPAGLTVSNQSAATGGVDPESLEQIKFNAPRSLYTLQRAVSADDYAILATHVPGVAAARVSSTTSRVVTIYVLPSAGGALSDSLREAVLTYLGPRKQVGTTVVIASPTYVPTTVRVTVDVLQQYQAVRVQQQVLRLLHELLDVDNVVLGDRITLSDIHQIVGSLDGVNYLTVTELAREGISPELSSDAVYREYEAPIAGVIQVLTTGGITS